MMLGLVLVIYGVVIFIIGYVGGFVKGIEWSTKALASAKARANGSREVPTGGQDASD